MVRMKKSILVLGIGGLTGSKIVQLSKNDFEIYGTFNLRDTNFESIQSFKLDITKWDDVKKLISKISPDVIINTCSLNNVDYCESHEDEAMRINVEAVDNLSKISKSLESQLIHLSTDSVFDGTKDTPYTEKDVPNPVNIYGYTKMLGEKIVLKNPNNAVVRASVLYGLLPKYLSNMSSSSMKPMNFAQWLITKLQAGEQVKIITDEYSSPIIADDFARSILHLVKGKYAGIFHTAPQVRINRYDFSIKLAKALNLDCNLIQSTTNKELGRNVKTGFNKCLDSSKMIHDTKFNFLSLDESFNLIKNQFLKL